MFFVGLRPAEETLVFGIRDKRQNLQTIEFPVKRKVGSCEWRSAE